MLLKNLVSLIKILPVLLLAAAAIPLGLASAAITPPSGKSLTLAWNPNPEPNLQGYRVYVGTVTGQYSQILSAGAVTSFQISQLQVGQTYYFAVAAVDGAGLESPRSTELAVTIATPPLPSGSQLSSNTSGGLALKWTFPTSHMGSSPKFIVQTSTDMVNWTQVATILAANSLGRDGQMENFSWPIPATTEARKFYRLTATNWLGSSTAL